MASNWAIFKGVRIIPKDIVFKNAYEGKVYREKLTLQNISSKPVCIKTVFPNTFSFKVDRLIHGEKLSCGLTFVTWINYTYTHSSTILAQMTIYVDDFPTEVNLEVLPSKSDVYCLPRNINFGKINSGYAVHVQKLILYNRGNRQTKFEFDISSNTFALFLSPLKGFILGGSSVEIEVNLICFEEGIYAKEIWVKCEHPFRLSVFVEVITPKLYICSPHDYTESFLPIMFPPIYGGCRLTQTFDVFNYNMLQTTFIIVPEYNLEIMAAHKVQEIDPTYKSFSFSPIEGDLEPSDSTTIEISFDPPKKKLLFDQVKFVCFRLIKLECQTVDKIINEQIKRKPFQRQIISSSVDETLSTSSYKPDRDSTSDKSRTLSLRDSELSTHIHKMSFGNYIRICVYAMVKSVKIHVEPGKFDLSEMHVNTNQTQFLNIINQSRTLPVFYEYEKTAYIKVEPPSGLIDVESRVTVKVIFTPLAVGFLDKRIQINLLYYSQTRDQTKKVLKSIGCVHIPVYIPVKLQTTHATPKFNLGITPQITNEVGIMTDDVRFSSKVKKPKMAVQQCYISKPSKKFDNAKISFPNDRPNALQPWRNKNMTCKTIFAEIPRVIAPYDEYMYTSDELTQKMKNETYYLNYIRYLRRRRSFGTHKKVSEDYITNNKKLLQNVHMMDCPAYWKKIFGSYYQEEFSSLKPIQIYFVDISPSKIFFSGVVVNTTVSYTIEIFNENIFSVHVLLTYFHRHKNILPKLPVEMIVKSNEKVTITKEFKPNTSGIFSTVLNVYLNSSHLIPILLQAKVIRPIVSVDFTDIIFGDKEPCYARPFPLRNKLNVPIVFSWIVPNNCCYTVCPMEGVIPPGRFIYCEIVYTPDLQARNCVKLTVKCEGGANVHIHVNACYSKSNVEVLEHKIEMPHIPLNIVTERNNILRNQGLETVLFQIRNPFPCYGVSIKPEKGSIRGRCDVAITITFLFEVFVKFDLKVDIEFEFGSSHFTIVGCVDFPTLLFKPKDKMEFKRTPAESFDILPFSIENRGESVVHLSFPKSFYPEMTVSGSSRVNIPLTSNIELDLEKKETVYLYIHFYPLDVCMNTIYLPIVFNDIIGPAEKHDDKSLIAESYFKQLYFASTEESNIERIYYDRSKISVLTLSTVSTKHILRFSKTILNFKYIPTVPSRTVISTEFKIKNCIQKVIEFCIDITYLKSNFDLSCKVCDSILHCDENIMAIKMNEEEEITFIAHFIPSEPGDYECNLPIYIKDIKDETVFNYIQMHASYPSPAFTVPRWCFLEPVPLGMTVVFDLTILICYHSPNCKIDISCELEQISFTINDKKVEPERPCRMHAGIQVRFMSLMPLFECKIAKFSCSCGASNFMIIGVCAAEDILATYTHYCPNVPMEPTLKATGFPLFPDDSDDSEFAIYMRQCVTVVERWIYDQVLNQTYYYCIPQDMSGWYRLAPDKKRKSRSTKDQKLLLMQILENLGCSNEITIPLTGTIMDDELTRVNELHCSLKYILIYLHQQGAYIPHVRSRYLLKYDDYVIYMKKVRPLKNKSLQNLKPKDLYFRRSKQCWLDLIISIFKTLVLARISMKKFKSKRRRSSVSKESSSLLTVNISPEQALLIWLDTIYHEEMENLLMLDSQRAKGFTLKLKEVSNFTSDLSNGLVFVAVTIHFCPYLIPYLQDIYIDVDEPEKAFHNAVLLVEVWKLINCSFKITPSEIVNAIALQMVFLVMYMYDVFCNLSPKEDLLFAECLGTKNTQEIVIRNPNTVEICLEIRYLNNKFNCFRALSSTDIIRVYPGKSYNLKIEYMAKKMEIQKVILILSGETPGQLYSKSQVYTLTGLSHFLGDHERKIIEVDLYKSVTLDLEIKSPYIEAAVYDCYCAKIAPKDLFPTDLVTVKDYLSTIRPRTIFAETNVLVTDTKGIGKKTVTICCLSTNYFDATIVFRNADIGDFFISIEVHPVNFNLIQRHSIFVNIPDNWDETKCTCSENKLRNKKRCSRRLVLKIPCKNDQFWNIIIEAIMQSISPTERQVWRKFLQNEMGPHILHWLMSGSQEIKNVQHMVDSNITYIVNNAHSAIMFPSSVVIENVRSDNYIEMDIHVVGDISLMKSIDFSLESVDGTEFRWYKLEFNRTITPSLPFHTGSKYRDIIKKHWFHSII